MSKIRVHSSQNRETGFTLIELVVVVLIIGILAAIAVPKLLDSSNDARINGTRQSLNQLRNAIRLYQAQNGSLPGDAGSFGDLKADLRPYLNGDWPPNQLPGVTGPDTAAVETAGTPLTASGTHGWKYDNVTGEIIINTAGYDHY